MRATWWWIDRWRKSTAFTDMTLDEQGAYRNLIDEQNLRGGAIPNDERILSRASGDPVTWPRIRDKVMARFELTKHGWRNQTAYDVMVQSLKRADRQARYRNKASNDPSNGEDNEARNDPRVSVSGSVSVSVSGSTLPTPPPADAGGAVTSDVTPGAEPPRLEDLVSEAARYSAEKGVPAFRDLRRRFRDWLKAGLTLKDVKAKIDAGEHVPRPPL